MSLSSPVLRKWMRPFPTLISSSYYRSFRSDAALEALASASCDSIPNLILYNYPSFSGAFSAVFAHLFHSRLSLTYLSLPFSSVQPFAVDDLCTRGLQRCYLLDFVGPRGFAVEFATKASSCEVIAFDHRKCVVPEIPSDCPENLTFRVDTEKSSSSAVYDYFSDKLAGVVECRNGMDGSLLGMGDRDRVEMVLKYIEDGDLRRWSLPDVRAFNIGMSEWRPKLNCFTNPYMYEQLLEISATDVIAKGKSCVSNRQKAAKKLLDKPMKLRLGRGLYGECLGVRADGNSELSDEMGKQLSVKSAAAGLRSSKLLEKTPPCRFSGTIVISDYPPIGAVIFMQRRNLKMCLRSTDIATDTSEVAKAYGGGGTPTSSSFIIRMDEYNEWVSGNSR